MISAGSSVTTTLLIQSLEEGVRPFLPVTSNSMTPLIRKGDEIRVTFTNKEQLKAGDIVVVHDASGFLAHRYWSTTFTDSIEYLLLRGDHLKQFDPPRPTAQLIGRVIARRRNGQTLDLSQGTGRRLDMLLIKIAAMAVPPPRSHPIEANSENSRNTWEPDRSVRVARWPIYGALYYLTRLLTLAVDFANQFQHKFGQD